MPDQPTAASFKAARALRIKIHDFGTGKKIDCTHAENPANKKWLDSVCADDAKIIEEHTHVGDLVKLAGAILTKHAEWMTQQEVDELNALLNEIEFGKPR